MTESVEWLPLILDPVKLNITQLREILQMRGVPVPRTFEKEELVRSVIQSGVVKQADIDLIPHLNAQGDLHVTNFTSAEEFDDIVEDTKDSVWLVSVVQRQQTIKDLEWEHAAKQLARFGVRAGHVDCSRSSRLCFIKNWSTPQLVLAMPRGYQYKADIFMTKYAGSPKSDAIIKWISDKLASRINLISGETDDILDWADFGSQPYLAKKYPVRLIYFASSKREVPLLFSAMSVKFTGRIRFGLSIINSTHDDRRLFNMADRDKYLLITKAWNTSYEQCGSASKYAFTSMDLFLTLLTPDVNNLFILTFGITNCYCVVEALLNVNRRFVDRLLRLFWLFLKLNFIVIVCWIPMTTAFSVWPLNALVCNVLSRGLHYFALTNFASSLRSIVYYSVASYTCQAGILVLWSTAIGYILWRFTDMLGDGSQSELQIWMSILAHRHPGSNLDIHMEDGGLEVEGIIDQLSAPNLIWLQTSRGLEYLHDLPKWTYSKSACSDSVSCAEGACLCSTYAERDCAVCIEEFDEGSALCGLPCGHTFHEECVTQWLCRGNHLCPVCRWPAFKRKTDKKHRE